MKKTLYVTTAFSLVVTARAQQKGQGPDSLKPRVLDSVFIRSTPSHSLPEIQGVYIFSGKKTDDIIPDASGANLAGNLARMVFARIPGLNVWEMDGAGTQVNIGSRGTDTHRSIEMNMRQNGYNTNSDMFGYPEDHYTPPMQAVREIQLVRGSAALQFGSQFGGMMNYIMKGTASAPSSWRASRLPDRTNSSTPTTPSAAP